MKTQQMKIIVFVPAGWKLNSVNQSCCKRLSVAKPFSLSTTKPIKLHFLWNHAASESRASSPTEGRVCLCIQAGLSGERKWGRVKMKREGKRERDGVLTCSLGPPGQNAGWSWWGFSARAPVRLWPTRRAGRAGRRRGNPGRSGSLPSRSWSLRRIYLHHKGRREVITKDLKNDSTIQKESGGFTDDRALHSGCSPIRGRHNATWLFYSSQF